MSRPFRSKLAPQFEEFILSRKAARRWNGSYEDNLHFFIISETRDGIVNEVNVIRSASQSALEQIDAHKRVIAACDQLLLDLNPQMKREQEQAGRIASLEKQLSGMSEQIAALTGMLSKTLAKKPKEE